MKNNGTSNEVWLHQYYNAPYCTKSGTYEEELIIKVFGTDMFFDDFG